jgi:benzoyl-CoA reductase subunit BamC
MCEDNEPGQEPLCVQWCINDALIYEEKEEEIEEEEPKSADIEIGLESLVDKYGLQNVMDLVARMAKKA